MSHSIGQALAGLTQAIADTADLTVDDALAIAALIPTLQQQLTVPHHPGAEQPGTNLADTHFRHDPRFALALASAAETVAQQSLRTQIYAAHLVEATAAHTLTAEELTRTREGATDFAAPAERTGKRPTFANPAKLLASWLQTEVFVTARRVEDAHHVIAQYDYQHQPYPAQFPLMAQRFNDPTFPPVEALSAARQLHRLEPKREEFATPTTSTALTEDGELAEGIVDQEMDEADPGTRRQLVKNFLKEQKERVAKKRPEEEEGIYRRGVRNGNVHFEVILGPARAELFESAISQSDNPRSEAGQAAREAFSEESSPESTEQEAPDSESEDFDSDSTTSSSEAADNGFAASPDDHPDFVTDEEAASGQEEESIPPSPAARRLNGLMNLIQINAKRLKSLLDATRNGTHEPQPPGTNQEIDIPLIKPQIVVMLTLDELEGRAKTHGFTSHGFKLGPTELRQLLADARIIPMVLGGKGELLDIGRSQRKHPSYMRLGIAVRDRGCLVPGCTMDPERCNIHHIKFWSEGGVTAVCWSAMLCDVHHHDVHAGLIKVIPDDGVPKVILPSFMDPTQTPVRNTYHLAKVA